MILWVLYDIQNDRARTKVAKYCKQAGLYRVQYSCFLGTIDTNRRDSLELQIEELIDAANDKVYVFPMNRQELSDCRMLGQAFDEKLITDEIKALFF